MKRYTFNRETSQIEDILAKLDENMAGGGRGAYRKSEEDSLKSFSYFSKSAAHTPRVE